MTDTPAIDTQIRQARRGWLALAGVLWVFAAPFAYALTIGAPVLARSGLVMWLVAGVGVGFSLYAWRQDRRRIVAIAAIAALAWTTLLAAGFFVLLRLPQVGAQTSVARTAPAFELPDATGQPVSLATLTAPPGRAVLLVFYRGFW